MGPQISYPLHASSLGLQRLQTTADTFSGSPSSKRQVAQIKNSYKSLLTSKTSHDRTIANG